MDHIQKLDFDKLKGLNEEEFKTESQRNIKKNSQSLLLKIKENFGNDANSIFDFVTFLVNNCYLVVVIASSKDSAFRVFSVLNDRGLDLKPTDIIKADIIGEFATDEEQDEHNERWQNMEHELGRDGFNNLFTYVRMIYAKEKAKKPLLDEFRNYVLSKVEPKALIEELEPYASALATVYSNNYKAKSYAEKVNTYLYWLNRIDNSDWIPVAILFLSGNENPEYVAQFFNSLERLAAYMHICGLNVNHRIKRYSDVIEALEGENSLNSPVQAVELTEMEKEKMREALNENIYDKLTAKRRNYLILRLDSFISDGATSYDGRKLTIEHVLPQTINNTEWANSWSDENHKEWVHRLANLIPLGQNRNSSAKNWGFEKKKEAYSSGTDKVPAYALTLKALSAKQWTPEHLQSYQSELLKKLHENWRLSA